ncbi:putative sporulation protein YtxC [Bacillus sp. AFS073361]|uniref:putative sporulation protein YtxC n=1 Tax=Bacillus sp. AFS073361 TaxID=2033511 RepID=UPI000BF81F99|nr:putative sporulation protein YtxC [Bacillus sp. AFS073361]PFP27769.1 putative sporulation protein YtxC [Bacillus sp. AFS073361]
MAEIIFQSKLDAEKFYDHLLKYLPNNHDKETILLIEDRHIVKFFSSMVSVEISRIVKHAFYEFITIIKRDDWFREILKGHYFYDEYEEQQQIIEIIDSILEGQREDLSIFLNDTNEEKQIKSAIDHIFQDNISFSFDSFLKFRLRPYLQSLQGYVEIAIDEYKMEQEYQIFVQMLREFLVNREPKMEVLHLLFDEEITFYNEQFVEMKRAELTRMIDRKLLVNHPVYVDSASIAPLLSLAPTTIFLYTKDPDEPLVRTIKNIFEERVTIKSFAALREVNKWAENQQSSENQA